MNLYVLALLLALAGCWIDAPRPGAAQPGTTASSPAEQALLARYPKLVRREGTVLMVASRGGWIRYENKDCGADADDCASYALDRAYLDGRLFGIEVRYYEGGDYMLADTQSLHECIGGQPIFSPSNRMVVVAEYNEAYETCAEGVGLWRLDPSLRKVRTVSPHVLTYPEHLRWRGDDCVEFTAIVGEYNEAARRTFFLVKDDPEWRLQSQPSSLCEA